MKFIAGGSADRLFEAFCDAAGQDSRNVKRIVVDLEVGNVATVYFNTFATTEIADLVLAAGIELVDTREAARR